MPFRCLLSLFLGLCAFSALGQGHYFRARVDGNYMLPRVDILQNTGGYEIRSGRPRAGLYAGYAYFVRPGIGFSASLQVAAKQYVVYEERRTPSALLFTATKPGYYTLSLPLALEYRGNPFKGRGKEYYRKWFFSLSAGAAMAYTKEYSITSRAKGVFRNYAKNSLSHRDDFSFVSVWGYELFLHPAYNFQLRNGSYVGLGAAFTLSPARYASLSIDQERDGLAVQGIFQPRQLNYVSLSLAYQIPLRKSQKKADQ